MENLDWEKKTVHLVFIKDELKRIGTNEILNNTAEKLCFGGTGDKLSSIQCHSVSSPKWFSMHEIVVKKQILQFYLFKYTFCLKSFNLRILLNGQQERDRFMNFHVVSFALTRPVKNVFTPCLLGILLSSPCLSSPFCCSSVVFNTCSDNLYLWAQAWTFIPRT